MKFFKTRTAWKDTNKAYQNWDTPIQIAGNNRRISELCKAHDFNKDWHKRWCSEIQEQPRYHRKQWEFTYIMQSLWERGCISENKRGLVFAVGSEPLPAVFAKHGCHILATDINPDKGVEKGWDNGNQLCFGIDSLNTRSICDNDIFLQRVKYRSVDMNSIPSDLSNFDFNWSSCSFEHLGSLEKGFAFLKNQLNTLKPGGWAVHTTEYNLSSNHETQENDSTVIYRKRDIDHIVDALRQEGHFVEELDFSIGNMEQDFVVDFPPYKGETHIRLMIDKFVATSIGLIIKKKG